MPTKTKQPETKKIPKFRFSDFFGGWEEKKLGDVVEFWNGKAHEKDISKNGKYIVVNSKFVSSNGAVKKYSDRQISPLKKDDISIVMSDIPKGKAIAKCFLVDENEKYTLNQRIGRIKSKEIISPFLFRILNRNKYYLKFDNGVSQTNLRKDEVLRCPVIFPSVLEQQKIAKFLDTVDEWIENLRVQKESFEKYKKGIMQKIFFQEVRFRDDDGGDFVEWEEKRFGEIVENFGGTSLEKYVDQNGDHKFISIGNYTKDGRYNDDGKRIVLNDSTKKKLLNKGDLVMVLNDKTASGDIIGSTILIDKNNMYIYNQRSERLVLDQNKVSPVFLWFLLNSRFFRRMIVKNSQGGTQIYINFPVVKKIRACLPSLPEQQKIADFLTSIDNLIISKQQQITQAESWKKGLMQGLFV